MRDSVEGKMNEVSPTGTAGCLTGTDDLPLGTKDSLHRVRSHRNKLFAKMTMIYSLNPSVQIPVHSQPTKS